MRNAGLSEERASLLLAVVGFNLSLLNLCLVRELASLRYCTELLLLVLLVCFFLGQALGFFFAHTLRRWRTGALLWLASPLIVLMGVRAVAGLLSAEERAFEFYLLALFYLASLSAVYASLLPTTLDSGGTTQVRARRFAMLYSAELSGALTALAVLVLLGRHQWWALVLLYPLSLHVMTRLLNLERATTLAVGLVALVSSGLYAVFDRPSSEFFYRISRNEQRPVEILFQGYSPYQKVEVVRVGGDKILLLNGVEYFGDGTLEAFNFYLSELPASLYRPKRVLVIGSGSMASVGRLAKHAQEVVTVELDPLVVEASLAQFSSLHPSDDFSHTIVYGDARRYLREGGDRFDLIALDIPTAFTLQTGTLFTRDFFHLAKSRLSENGVLSLYLTQMVGPRYRAEVAGPILRAVAEEFPEFHLVVAGEAENSFVYAGENLPFSRAALDEVLARSGRPGLELFEEDRARRLAADYAEANLSNLGHIWEHQ